MRITMVGAGYVGPVSCAKGPTALGVRRPHH